MGVVSYMIDNLLKKETGDCYSEVIPGSYLRGKYYRDYSFNRIPFSQHRVVTID